jgi:hypothetical protein
MEVAIGKATIELVATGARSDIESRRIGGAAGDEKRSQNAQHLHG